LLLATFTVSNTGDMDFPETAPGSLRDAIVRANAEPGLDQIVFDIPETDPGFDSTTGFFTILPSSPLPPISDRVTLDADTRRIALNGGLSVVPGAAGLTITAGGSTVRGLVISNFTGSGIRLEGNGRNVLENNFIGTDPTGRFGIGNRGDGVTIVDSSDNTIGAPDELNPDGTIRTVRRNVISGNDSNGITIGGANSMRNVVQNNRIGTDVSGNQDLGNALDGIQIVDGSVNVLGPGNLISGNNRNGISIIGNIARGNQVEGNFIGTNAAGNSPLSNGDFGALNIGVGVSIIGATSNTIGGTVSEDRNVISGNLGIGVAITDGALGNLIWGNFIGTDAAGIFPLGNLSHGVAILGSTNNRVGGTEAGMRNLISGNLGNGVVIDGPGAVGNLIAGNSVGTNAGGTAALGNFSNGVAIFAGGGNAVGGTATGEGNVISGNQGNGVVVSGTGVRGILIAGNSIGTNAGGTAALGNFGDGVFIDNVSNVTIGGPGTGARNVLSGNQGNGIRISGADAENSLIAGNYIGTTANGSLALGNSGDGVRIADASGNTIGGTVAGAGNVIAGNQANGVEVAGAGSIGNLVAGNYIGINAAGTARLGNGMGGNATVGYGVLIANTPGHTIGGTTPTARNVISGNNNHGIRITGTGATGILVQGNFIGTDTNGILDLGNQGDGLHVEGGPGITIGGTAAGAGNVISGNAGNGIAASGTAGLLIQNNFIGTDATGTNRTSNDGDGVTISNPADNPVGGDVILSNIISGNAGRGLVVIDSPGVQVLGNFIGTDRGGTIALGNDGDGVTISYQPGNTGGGDVVAGNIISSNGASVVGSTARGLVITGSPGLTVRGNRIGTDGTGTGDRGNAGLGVAINGSPGATIGGTADTDGNVISGNRGGGLAVSNSPGIRVLGNTIGTNRSGTDALGNNGDGVTITDSAGNTVGGNVISGNAGRGLVVSASPGVQVLGNSIGTNRVGAAALGNNGDGVTIDNLPGNTVGGYVVAGNVISGNAGRGLVAANSPGLVVRGNAIGTDRGGTRALGNTGIGVAISGSPGATIGGTADTDGNVISGNLSVGLSVTNTSGLLVRGNRIGTDALGNFRLGNAGDGVRIDASPGATIGGPAAADRNVIAGSGLNGVVAFSSPGLVVQGNFIGTDGTGIVALGNVGAGVRIDNPFGGATADVIIGNVILASGSHGVAVTAGASLAAGTLLVQGNAIADSGGDGVRVAGIADVRVLGNRIGADAAGSSGRGDVGAGVRVIGAAGVVVGGLGAAEGNLIVSNQSHGVQVTEGGSLLVQGNVISENGGDGIEVARLAIVRVVGNLIGTDPAGSLDRGNIGAGVEIVDTLRSAIGGPDAADRNVITGNRSHGVAVTDSPDAVMQGNVITLNGLTGVGAFRSPRVLVQGNLIGTDSNGALGLGNVGSGVFLINAPNSTVGGTAAGTGNVIGGGGSHGIEVSASSGILVQGNLIGVGVVAGRTVALGNAGDGVRIDNSALATIGGMAAAARNVISANRNSGVFLVNATADTVVQGNLIGTDVGGAVALGNSLDGVFLLNAPRNLIGGTTVAARNVIAGNISNGVELSGAGSSGNAVVGNFIGTDSTGNLGRGNARSGVAITGAPSNVIGGNLISSNFGGVTISSATDTVLRSNLIGTDATGSAPLGNVGLGVYIIDSNHTVIGGTAIGEGNLIAFSSTGVLVIGGTGNSILSNSIFGNALGIDLGIPGPTLNDPGDLDAGANNLQNFPSLTLITTASGGTTIEGMLNSTPNSTFTLQFFADAGNPTGFGQGRAILGQMTVTTDVAGNVSFTVSFPVAVPRDQVVSATATDSGGNTSEFSQAITEIVFAVINTNDSGPGSLRQAILNANTVPGGQTIDFAIPGPGPFTIVLDSALPTILGPVVIDGYAQPGARPNSRADGDDALLRIELNGAGAGPEANGLTILAGSSIVRGLVINHFNGNGIALGGEGGDVIEGNFIGTDVTGTVALGNLGFGVSILDSPNHRVGGTTAAARNVISGNGLSGVAIGFAGSTGIQVLGNFIGTDTGGTVALGNASSGLEIFQAAVATVGGTVAGTGNIVSGNRVDGVRITAPNSVVQGNFIGTEVTGTAALGNLGNGITVNAANTTIGGLTAGARNVISGNLVSGVQILGRDVTGTMVQGNHIGTNAAGTAALGNRDGVLIENAPNHTIGGTTAGARNVISGNRSAGVHILGSLAIANHVLGNFIGTDASGVQAVTLGNSSSFTADVRQVGVRIENAPDNFVEGANLIGGNLTGIEIRGPVSQRNLVRNNLIGVAPGPDGVPGNGDDRPLSNYIGVSINAASNNTIGGSDGGGTNLIARNVTIGVAILDATATGNVVQGNTIASNGAVVRTTFDANNNVVTILVDPDPTEGVLRPGTTLVGSGIYIDAARSNIIGAYPPQGPRRVRGGARRRGNRPGVTDPSRVGNSAQGNTISENRRVGVYIFGGADGNSVRRNRIASNGDYGVFVYNARNNVNDVILTGADGNRISGSAFAPFREFTGPVQPGELVPSRRNLIIPRRNRPRGPVRR
jgi:parallel beta-helix repeat protein